MHVVRLRLWWRLLLHRVLVLGHWNKTKVSSFTSEWGTRRKIQTDATHRSILVLTMMTYDYMNALASNQQENLLD